MKDIKSYIETEKAKYPIVFNLNVMEDLQEKFGSMQAWSDLTDGTNGEPSGTNGEPNIKALKYGLMVMINEAIDMQNEENDEKMAFVNEKQVGRIITEVGMAKIGNVVRNTTIKSVDTGEQPKNM